MKKIAWFKHPNYLSNDKRLSALIDHEGGRGYETYLYIINRTTTHPQKNSMETTLDLPDNSQATDRELPNNMETLCKNEEGQNDNNSLNTSNKDRKPALARVRVEKSREDTSRVDESRKNDFVVKKNGDEGEVQATQNAMPPFRLWRELIGNLTEGSKWKSLQPEPSKCHT